MRKGFLWDYASIQGVAAMMWSAYQKEVDVERIRQCKKALRDEAEVFAILRTMPLSLLRRCWRFTIIRRACSSV